MTVHAYDPARWTTTPPPSRDTSLDPHHVTETIPVDYHDVPGWGVDRHHRPMVPMELPSDVETVRGEVRYWQVPEEKVHLSVEHPNLTPVFGTSCPPRGLSGRIRDYAYRYSEATNRHWMTLVFADRVQLVEALVGGILTGRPDNIPAEKAWGTRLHAVDPARRVRYMVAGAAAVAGAVGLAVLVRNMLADEE